MTLAAPFGSRLREWRRRRGLSQLELAHRASTTPRYVSFLETGRSRPGEGMVLKLASALEVPLRERNALLRSAGLPPLYAERGLDDDALGPYRAVIARLLAQQEPFPAYVMDRRWDIVESNQGGRWLLPPGPLPADALAWILEPGPLAEGLVNRTELLWAFRDGLSRDLEEGEDPELQSKLERVEAALAGQPRPEGRADRPVLCPVLRWGDQEVRTFTTVMRFGNAREVTLDELRVELVFPEDAASEAVLRALGGGGTAG